MNRRTVFRGLLWVCFAFLAACPGSNDGGGGGGFGSGLISATTGGSVTTTDGKAKVQIPAGALDSDQTITIERLASLPPDPDLDEVTDGGVAYRLEPAGLTFKTPVTFTVELDEKALPDGAGGVTAPLILAQHLSEDGTPLGLSDLQSTVDLDTGRVTVSGAISSFSRLSFPVSGRIGHLLLNGLPDAVVARGTEFSVTGGISLSRAVQNDSAQVDVEYTDDSFPPIRKLSIGEIFTMPLGAPVGSPRSVQRLVKYQCDTSGGTQVLQAFVDVSLFEAATPPVDAWQVEKRSGSGYTLIPDGVIVTRHLFQKKVTCEGPPRQVSMHFDDPVPTAEHGQVVLFVESTVPVEELPSVSVKLSGTAVEGVDFILVDESGNPITTIDLAPLSGGKPGARSGPKSLDSVAGGSGRLRLINNAVHNAARKLRIELGLARTDVTPPAALEYDLPDDPTEPTLESDALGFSVYPRSVTTVKGGHATFTLTEIVKDGTTEGLDIDIDMEVIDPAVLSAPHLFDFDGTLDVTPIDADGLIYPFPSLAIDNLSAAYDNWQQIQFFCLQPDAGAPDTGSDITLRFYDRNAGKRLLTALDTTLHVTCKAPSTVAELVAGLAGPDKVEKHVKNFGWRFIEAKTGKKVVMKSSATARSKHAPGYDLGLDPSGHATLVAGANGVYAYDLGTGLPIERLNLAVPGVNMYGGIVLNDPDGTTPRQWLLAYGDTQYALTTYDPVGATWDLTALFSVAVTDMVAEAEDVDGHNNHYLVVDYQHNQVLYYQWSQPDNGTWDRAPARIQGDWWDFYATKKVISAVEGFAGPGLVVMEDGANPGEVWWWDPTDLAGAGSDVLVGATGVSPRYIRCLDAVCVITNYADSTITVLYWPDRASPPTIVGTQAVGTGPVGVELIPDGGGTGGILALTTGTGSDDFTVTPIAADGTIGTATTTSFTDCAGPGYAAFAGVGGTQVVGTCHDNARIEVVTR